MKSFTKHREWVKTAAIVFLAVMLLLTFFSRTIMNHSLAEVAVQRVNSGKIHALIRGTGTLNANEMYEVVLEQNREVRSVPVMAGQEVKEGDVLFLLEGTGEEPIQAAEEELRRLYLQYDQAIIQAAGKSYASQNYAIQIAQEKLNDAIAERDAIYITDSDIQIARDAVTSAEAYVAGCQLAVDQAQQDMAALGLSGQDTAALTALVDSLTQQLAVTQSDITAVTNEIETSRLIYGSYYDSLEQQAREQITVTAEYLALTTDEERSAYIQAKLPVYLPYVAEQYRSAEGEDAKYFEAYSAIQEPLSRLALLQQTESQLQTQLANAQQGCEQIAPLISAQDTLAYAQKALTDAELHLEALIQQQINYKAACEQVKSLQQSLQSQLISLETQQAADYRSSQIQELQLGEMMSQITRQEEKIAELQETVVRGEVFSPVDGIIHTIHVNAGQPILAGVSMATIEVPSKGYNLQFSVSAEQAALVKIGSPATISNYFWGGGITATLTNILPDPEEPMEKKLLVFELTGEELNAGATLSLTVSQQSAQYDLIVPNSAIRSDSNGTFVLVVTEKSSALGTRYTARRVDVEILAQDDMNTAVFGVLSVNDFVITTASKPIGDGSMVKMAE